MISTFLTFGPLPHQPSCSLYLYPYFSWYILPPTLKYFFVGVIFFFSCLVARDWEDFKFLGDLLYWGNLISFLEDGARPFSSRKLMEEWNEIMKLMEWKNSWWQNYLLDLCMLTFHTFNWELSLWDFFKHPLKLQKKSLLLFDNNSLKMRILFDVSSKYVNIVW